MRSVENDIVERELTNSLAVDHVLFMEKENILLRAHNENLKIKLKEVQSRNLQV